MISFYLKWRNGTEELIRQFKDCQNEEELLELIKDNMIIGEEQLRQIIDLQDELNECRVRPTLDTDDCGHCKHFQIDGMFGLWCEKGNDWTLVDKNCSDFER